MILLEFDETWCTCRGMWKKFILKFSKIVKEIKNCGIHLREDLEAIKSHKFLPTELSSKCYFSHYFDN